MWRAAVILPGCWPPHRRLRRNMPRPRLQRRAHTIRLRQLDSLDDWRRLRQSSGYSFADYARFLIANPGWPDETQDAPMGRESHEARRKRRDVLAFFTGTNLRPAMVGRGWPMPMRRPAGRPKRSTRRATPGHRPTSADRRAIDLGALWPSFTAPTMIAGSMPCCSRRSRTMRARFLTADQPGRRGLRGADRHADQRRRCRAAATRR